MKNKPVLADLHTHLNEKKVKPEQWWKSAREKNLSVIAITEHSYFNPKEAYLKLKQTKPKEIILIPGVESKTSAGDVLFYGTDERIYEIKEIMKKDVNIEEALSAAKKNNLAIVFAHPYGYKYDSICEVIGEKKAKQLMKKYSAGVEYYNGMLGSATELVFGKHWIKNIYHALEYADKNKAITTLRINKTTNFPKMKLQKIAEDILNRVKKGMLFSQKAKFITAGSDAHYPKSIGSAVIELNKKPKNEKEFIEMLKKNKIKNAGPNLYSKNPVDTVSKKEMIEGILYLTKKNVLKKRKIKIVGKIKGSIRLGKRIKTIKQISKKAKDRMPKLKLKKKLEIIGEKLGLEK